MTAPERCEFMGKIKPAPTAHALVAIMYPDDAINQRLRSVLEERLGPLLAASPVYRVTDFTDYYSDEFGASMRKQILIFAKPVALENFHRIKVWTNTVEQSIESGTETAARRIVNIDPGFLELSKLVLYSTKNFSHRVYIGDGIFGEVTMLYEHGHFTFLPWTYPDYAWEQNVKFLLKIRHEIAGRIRKI